MTFNGVKAKKKDQGRTCSRKSHSEVSYLNQLLEKYAEKNGLNGVKAAMKELKIPASMKYCTSKQISGYLGLVKSKLRRA